MGKGQIAVSVSNGVTMLFCNNDVILLSEGGGGKKGIDCIEFMLCLKAVFGQRGQKIVIILNVWPLNIAVIKTQPFMRYV